MPKKALSIFAAIWFISLFICGFLAYMTSSSNADGPCDGLGRHLTPAPALMRVIFGQRRMWAGWGWFIGDMTIFWGSIAIVANVGKQADSK